MEDVRKLSDDELVAKLKAFGENAGPLTSSTRSIFERRLLKHLSGGGPEGDVPESSPSTAGVTTDKGSGDAGLLKKLLPSEDEKEPDVYYGVQLPLEAKDKDQPCVFIDKTEALRFMKRNQGSRFKAFDARDKAERFAKRLVEVFPKSVASPKPVPSQVKPQPSPTSPVIKPPVPEGSEFRSVKTQDLVKLRKFIEVGDVQSAKQLLWSNPRYLINSGDTPTILQEGFRYNALHVAAMRNQPQAAQLILDTIQSREFMQRLYPMEPEESRENRIQFLLDLYINTPDKGNCECPLHFACKFGNVEVVDVLTSVPLIAKQRKNKYGETPSDMICTRAKVQSIERKDKIKELLEDRFFVPLLRTDDNSCSPHIATPWSPTVEEAVPWSSPTGVGGGSPLRNGNHASPRDSPVSVKAYAGPMSNVQAKKFRKNWHTPPSSSPKERKGIADIKRRDSEKGMERVGRTIAHSMRIPWMEFWEFLGCYVDLATDEGLEKLETYLAEQHASLRRHTELEDDLMAVADQLSKLNLSATSPKLVLYLDSDSELIPDTKQNDQTNQKHEEEHFDNSVTSQSGNQTSNKNVIRDGLLSDRQSSEYDNSLLRDFNMNSEFTRHRGSEREEDEESDGSYHTAMDLDFSDTESLFTPPQTMSPTARDTSDNYYINGSQPSKLDVDVVRALDCVLVDPSRYPRIHEWRQNVLGYKETERISWGTPKHTRVTRASQSTPVRSPSGTPFRPYSPSTLGSPSVPYQSPSLSFSSQGSFTDSDSSFDTSVANIRSNLMASFLSEK